MPPVPFRLEITAEEIADLRARLTATRWPDKETVDDWSQGVPLAYMRELVAYWAQEYDMQRLAERLNALPQFRLPVDGLAVHFLHVRSPQPGATPLLLTHGWPGSVVEFLKVIGPLTDPVAHGGEAGDAFDVVCPSLPGYGFSDRPATTGWNPDRIARAWAMLMTELGYERFAAQGGDWGSFITTSLGRQVPDRLIGIHLNYPPVGVPALLALGSLTEEEQQQVAAIERFRSRERGYAILQGTRPQTLGYGLADSPAAQCAWIIEKFRQWTDPGTHPEAAFSRDELLDNIMVYWLTGTGASSARLYWERDAAGRPTDPVTVPTAYTAFPSEINTASERWLATMFSDVRSHRYAARGGHFAAMEQPELFVDEVRRAFRAIRTGG